MKMIWINGGRNVRRRKDAKLGRVRAEDRKKRMALRAKSDMLGDNSDV